MDTEKIMEEVKKSNDVIEQSVAVARVLAEANAQHERNFKRLWIAFIGMVVVILVMGCMMIYTALNGQKIITESLTEALQGIAEIGVEETTTTTTQEASGDNATFNNIDGKQYNDNATKQGE